MALRLTPEILCAAYDFVASTEPFNRWNLPEGEDIRFVVTKSRGVFARYIWDGRHTIEVSSASVAFSSTLIEKISHEAIHMHLQITGMESRSNDPNVHNTAFRKLAALVCSRHGFDPKAFY